MDQKHASQEYWKGFQIISQVNTSQQHSAQFSTIQHKSAPVKWMEWIGQIECTGWIIWIKYQYQQLSVAFDKIAHPPACGAGCISSVQFLVCFRLNLVLPLCCYRLSDLILTGWLTHCQHNIVMTFHNCLWTEQDLTDRAQFFSSISFTH